MPQAQPSGDFGCRGCDITWGGFRTCHCSACHETFSGVTNFDKHQRNGECRKPQKCGLKIGYRGVWVGEGEYEPQISAVKAGKGTS